MKEEMTYMEFQIDEAFRLFVESLVNGLSSESDDDKKIDILLDGIVEYYKADRAYIIEGDFEPVCAINTHERTAHGKPLQQDTLKDFPASAYVRWSELFLKEQPVVIENMEEIRESLPEEYAYFSASDVQSIIIVPFSWRIARGFVGIDNPRRYRGDPLALRVLTYIIVAQVAEVKLDAENAALLKVSKYPDKYVQAKLLDNFEISARGGVLSSKSLSPQGKTILTILLLNPKSQFSTRDIYEVICSAEKDGDNESTIVSNAVYKVRNALAVIGLKDLIKPDHGVYYIDPSFAVETDVERFNQLCREMQITTETDEKIRIGMEAIELYHSSLPSEVCNSPRCDMEAIHLETQFLDISQRCAELLNQKKRSQEAFRVLDHALRISKGDGAIYLLTIQIMKQAHLPGIKLYINRAKKFLSEEEMQDLNRMMKQNRK